MYLKIKPSLTLNLFESLTTMETYSDRESLCKLCKKCSAFWHNLQPQIKSIYLFLSLFSFAQGFSFGAPARKEQHTAN